MHRHTDTFSIVFPLGEKMTFESPRFRQPEDLKGKPTAAQFDASEYWSPPYIANGVNDRQIAIATDNRAFASQPLDAVKPGEASLEHKLIFHNNTTDAYQHAFATHQPLVVVFTQKGQYSEIMQQELNSMQLGTAASKAVFLHADPNQDLAALGLAKRLGIQYPSISILDTRDPDKLNEAARIVGYVPNLKKTLGDSIQAVLAST